MAINTVFKLPIYRILTHIKDKPFFQWPGKMRGDPADRDSSKFCSFHLEKGHMTEDCRTLKHYLEYLVKKGFLKEFLQEAVDANTHPYRLDANDQLNGDEGILPKKVIHVVEVKAKNNPEARHQFRKGCHSLEVLKADVRISKRVKTQDDLGLSFTDSDLEGLQLPHNDPLILTLSIGECEVRRALIDSGSSVDIMFYRAFEQLGRAQQDIIPVSMQLIGLGSLLVWPLGMLREKVQVGGKSVETEFLVVSAPSSYNVIMGRPWIHNMGAVHSTLHQAIKFPLKGRIMCVRGDQLAARQSSKVDKHVSGVHMVHSAPQILEEAGIPPNEKSVETLRKIAVSPSEPLKYFLIGNGIAGNELESLIGLL